jgi:CheY-like chemotaxis protein
MSKVVSLGQCAADNYTLTQFLESNFGAAVVPADTSAEALAHLRAGPFVLVLVNRIFDRDGASGLAFISQLKEDAALAAIPVMLVSNYAEAQQQAVARGALPGFGKAGLGEATLVRLEGIFRERRPTLQKRGQGL